MHRVWRKSSSRSMPRRPRNRIVPTWVAVTVTVITVTAALPRAHGDELPAATNGSQERSFRFEYDIAPILARHGCAAADCHGGATGRANFKLSLFATDARADYRALTQDLDGRRVDYVDPSQSLLLKKPTRQLKHKGGKIFSIGDEVYQTLTKWIEDGAPFVRGKAHQLEKLSVGGAARGQLEVTAHFVDCDGKRSQRDVTKLARFGSTNTRTATVDEDGRVTGKEPGIAWITATYAGHSQRDRWHVPFPPPATASESRPQASSSSGHPLDQAWVTSLHELGLAPAPPAPARILVRRLYLDLAGRTPSPGEVAAFLELPEAQRVASTVDQLLRRPEFLEAMAPHLWQWFEIPGPGRDDGPRKSTYEALRNQLGQWLALDESFEELAGRILATKGSSFLQRFEDPRDRAVYFGRTLLGLSIGCARCHNHPLDRWRQDEHLRFSAWFANPRPAPERPGTMMAGKFFLPGDQQAVAPALLPIGGALEPTRDDSASPQQVLEQFLLGSGREAFTRNLVNRVFGWLVSRLLVDPADDHRLTNPALHEPLIEALIASNPEGLRELIRFVVLSRVYQVTSDPPSATQVSSSDPTLHYLARRESVPLTDIQRQRSIRHALGVTIPLETSAAESPLAQQLAQMNDGRLHAALSDPGNALEGLMLFEPEASDRLEALFQLILSRSPNEKESQAFVSSMENEKGARDLAFALFSSREFGSKR